MNRVRENDRQGLKTKASASPENPRAFNIQCCNRMVEDSRWKNNWWFVFLMRRADAKVNKSKCVSISWW
ncbi:MAG: hypothetical protein ACTSWN_16080 [Promethearchaeota archaeon]